MNAAMRMPPAEVEEPGLRRSSSRRSSCALAPRRSRSEVPDDVRRTDPGERLGGSDEPVGVAVEGRRVERAVIGDLRTDLDLRREPVLPAEPGFDIAGLGAGALAFHVIVELAAP